MCQRETRNYFHNLRENNNSNGQRGELQLWYQQVGRKTFQWETFSSSNCCRPDLSSLDCTTTDTNKILDKKKTLGSVCPSASATNFNSIAKNTNSTAHSGQQFKWVIFKIYCLTFPVTSTVSVWPLVEMPSQIKDFLKLNGTWALSTGSSSRRTRQMIGRKTFRHK